MEVSWWTESIIKYSVGPPDHYFYEMACCSSAKSGGETQLSRALTKALAGVGGGSIMLEGIAKEVERGPLSPPEVLVSLF